MTVQAVVFDIGNVLITWAPERLYDAVYGPDRRRELFAAVDLAGMNDRVDLGEGFRDVIYAFADENPLFRDEIRMWHDRWLDMASPAIPYSVNLMRALRKKGVPVFSLSNFGRESYQIAVQRYPFLAEFDRDFISAHHGLAKPDPDFFALLETETGLSAPSLLFTDDRAENIDAARNRGWHAHLFDGPEGLAQELIAHGLLTREEARP